MGIICPEEAELTVIRVKRGVAPPARPLNWYRLVSVKFRVGTGRDTLRFLIIGTTVKVDGVMTAERGRSL